MFSTTPNTGTLICGWRNIARPFVASARATFCGVVTITAPVTGTLCTSVRWMSDVPGGRSMSR